MATRRNHGFFFFFWTMVLCGLMVWHSKLGIFRKEGGMVWKKQRRRKRTSAPPPAVCGRKQPPTERVQRKLWLRYLLSKRSSFQTPRDEMHRNITYTTDWSSVPACYGPKVCDSSPCPTLPSHMLKPLTHSVTGAGDRAPKEVVNNKCDHKSGALTQQDWCP